MLYESINFANEEWRPIFGWEGLYEASSFGRIRSVSRIARNGRRITGRIRAVRAGSCGYYLIGLYHLDRIKMCSVHVLIAEAFYGARPPGLVVHHIDGTRTNNRVGNLTYVTPSENILAAPMLCGEASPTSKLTEQEVWEIRQLHGYLTNTVIAKHYGISATWVGQIVRRKFWRHVA